MIVAVPNNLRDAIYRKLDAAIEKCPAAEKDRDALYHDLLNYFFEHGVIPDFKLTPKEKPHAGVDDVSRTTKLRGD